MGPLFGAIMGEPGAGKTLMLLRAFPNALVVGPKGCINTAEKIGLPIGKDGVAFRQIGSVHEVYERAAPGDGGYLAAAAKAGRPLIVEDMSLLGDDTRDALIDQGYSGWDIYNQTQDVFTRARRMSAASDTTVMWTFHPSKDNTLGKVLPDTPGKKLPPKLPGAFSLYGVAHHDDTQEWSNRHPYRLTFRSTEDTPAKSRVGEFPMEGPMSLRFPLEASGHVTEWPEAVRWLPDWVDEAYAARYFEDAGKLKEVAGELVRGGIPMPQVRWAIWDLADKKWFEDNKPSIDRMIDDIF